MQSLRSTSLRRLCLSATVSVTRTRPNLQLPALFCHTRPFASSSPRWDSSASQFHRQTIQEMKEEPSDVEGAESPPTKVRSASNTLYIGNMPYSTTDDELCEIFSVYGPLRRVQIAKNNKGMPMGYAHIDFESKEAAIKANKDHQESPMTIGDREIRMDYAFPATHKGGPPPPRRAVKDRFEPCPTIFIGGVPYEATRDDIRESLKPLGEVVAVRISLSKEGNPKGFAHVDFKTTAEAEKVLDHYKHNPVHILGREVRLDRSKTAENAYPPVRRLYFTKWAGDKASLNSYFGALRSKITNVQLFPSPDPEVLTASGYVEFTDLQTATEALARFNTPELTLAYARTTSRTLTYPKSEWRGRGVDFGLQKRRGRAAPVE